MGLDAVTIVMDVEDHFGLSIRNSEAESIRTVGDLASLIKRRIDAAARIPCPTLKAFLSLRRTVRTLVGDPQYQPRPRTNLSSALAVSQRRTLWKRLATEFDLHVPSLRRPPALRAALVVCSCVLLLLAFLAAAQISLETLPASFAAAALGILFINLVTLPLRRVPPDGWETYGDIARHIAGFEVATRDLGLRDMDDIMAELAVVLVDVLGVDVSEITADARFIEDLGMS